MCNIETIDRHLADQPEQHNGQDEKPVTAYDIDLDTIHKRQEKVCNILQKDEVMWSGQVGDINITKMRIGLVLDAKLVHSAPYRADSRTRRLNATIYTSISK